MDLYACPPQVVGVPGIVTRMSRTESSRMSTDRVHMTR